MSLTIHITYSNVYMLLHIVKCSSVLTMSFTLPVTGGPSILTTVVPVGPQPTHMICPHCRAEIDTSTKTEPGIIAYISGFIICLLG